MKAYKVVLANRRAGKYYSCCKIYGRVEYIPKKWVTPLPGNGPLCCFKNKQLAADFMAEHIALAAPGREKLVEIWECEIVQSKDCYAWTGGLKIHVESFPEGTILADKVKLIKKVSCKHIK